MAGRSPQQYTLVILHGDGATMTLADRIRFARRRRGWSQAKLAEHLGVTAGAVGHWERDSGADPSFRSTRAIAIALDVSIEWLALGRGAMQPGDTSHSSPPIIPLSEDEQALLQQYRGLSVQARSLLSKFLEALQVSLTPVGTTVTSRNQGRQRV